MSSLVTPSAPVKSSYKARSVKLLVPPAANGMPGMLTISVTKGKKTETVGYHVSRMASDFGDCFRLRKVIPTANEPNVYDVCLSDEGHTCECLGHLRHGHCKHADALAALRDRRLI